MFDAFLFVDGPVLPLAFGAAINNGPASGAILQIMAHLASDQADLTRLEHLDAIGFATPNHHALHAVY